MRSDGALRNVQPVLERGGDSVWVRVEEARDALWRSFRQACVEEGFDALVIKSAPFEQPAWVKVECWVPKNGRAVTARGSALVKILAREFHRHEIVYTADLRRGGWSKAYKELHGLREEHCKEIARFVLGLAGVPLRFRALRWRWWKRRNKVIVLRRDWIVNILGPLGLLWNLIRNHVRQPRTVVLSSGKPEAEPRVLHLVDSWQTVISGLGEGAPLLRERLLGLLEEPPIDGFESRVENIWYWGLDGTVEREQIVMTLRRAWVFCQIYQYDEELYVGWEAYLNTGQWVEKSVATGIGKETRQPTEVKTVEKGEQPLNEYDLVDLNCLSEWTHARLVRLVQRLMEERNIQQDIDFKVIRGDRSRVEALGTDGNRGRGRPRVRGALARTG